MPKKKARSTVTKIKSPRVSSAKARIAKRRK